MKYNELDTVIYVLITLLFVAGAAIAFEHVIFSGRNVTVPVSRLQTQAGENFTEGYLGVRPIAANAVCFNKEGFVAYVNEWQDVFGRTPVITAALPQEKIIKVFAKEADNNTRPYYVFIEQNDANGNREHCMIARGENVRLSLEF